MSQVAAPSSPAVTEQAARTSAPPSDYARLKRRIKEAGLLDKEPRYYAILITVNLFLFAGCLALFLVIRNPWLQALNAAALGVISGQLGFQLHDAGHNQMFAGSRKNTVVGLLTADLLLGMSYGWWVQKHNSHHANPNHVDLDPDINNPAIVYTEEQALGRRGPLRWMASHQAYLFFPLLGLLAWSMHVTGIRFLVGQKSRYRRLELAVLVVHAILYVGLLLYFLGPWSALLVVVIHKGIGGFYLASVFAPNHKGMLQTDSESKLDFLRSQVLTSRNIRAHWMTDMLYGSLNYQIEHHLFPTMPRKHVRKAHAIVRQFCEEAGVSYHETSMVQSYRELLGFLHAVGEPLRAEARAEAA